MRTEPLTPILDPGTPFEQKKMKGFVIYVLWFGTTRLNIGFC